MELCRWSARHANAASAAIVLSFLVGTSCGSDASTAKPTRDSTPRPRPTTTASTDSTTSTPIESTLAPPVTTELDTLCVVAMTKPDVSAPLNACSSEQYVRLQPTFGPDKPKITDVCGTSRTGPACVSPPPTSTSVPTVGSNPVESTTIAPPPACGTRTEQVISAAGAGVSDDGTFWATWSSSRPLDAGSHSFVSTLGDRFQLVVSTVDFVTTLQLIDRSVGGSEMLTSSFLSDGETASVSLPATKIPGVAPGTTWIAQATERGVSVGCLTGSVSSGG